MEEQEVIDFTEICRVCMETSPPDEMNNLLTETEDESLMNVKYLLCEFLKLQLESELPTKICQKCEMNAGFVWSFVKQCLESDETLREILVKHNETMNATTSEVDEPPLPRDNTTIGLKIESMPSSKLEHDEEIEMATTVETKSESDETGTGKIKVKSPQNLLKEDVTYQCVQCSKEFVSKQQMNTHIRDVHKRFMCGVCYRDYPLQQTLNRHMLSHQEDQKNKMCTFCGKCFYRPDDLKRHIRIHTGERPYKCDQCDKGFKQHSELKEHKNTHGNSKRYVCALCGKVFASRNGLYVHTKVHNGVKNFECQMCGNTFVTGGELNSHINHIHKQAKNFKCTHDGCDMAFISKSALKIHDRVHTGEKPFKCEECSKEFNTRSNLADHLRSHTHEKLSECTVCMKRLCNSQALKKHMRLHTGEKPYDCEVCDEKFISWNSLYSHMKRKHSDMNFPCIECSKMFVSEKQLEKHRLTHLRTPKIEELDIHMEEEVIISS